MFFLHNIKSFSKSYLQRKLLNSPWLQFFLVEEGIQVLLVFLYNITSQLLIQDASQSATIKLSKTKMV